MKKKRKNRLLKEAVEYDLSRFPVEEEEEDIDLDQIIFIEEEEYELN